MDAVRRDGDDRAEGSAAGVGTVRAMIDGMTVRALGAAFIVCIGVGVSVAFATPDAAALVVGGARYQETDDWDGETRVTVDIAPVTRETELTIDVTGSTSETSLSAGEAPRGETQPPLAVVADHGADRQEMVEGTAQEAVNPVEPSAAASLAPTASEPQAAAVVLGDIDTGGHQGATVVIGDTMGGQGEPGAPGGDAIVDVSIGPITDGTAIAGEATPGEVVSLSEQAAGQIALDPELASPADTTLPNEVRADAAQFGLFTTLGVTTADTGEPGVAVGGAATGGSARPGEATVTVVIGDTIGGDGDDGQAGGDAVVVVDVGRVSGGDATGGAASGGDAIQGTGAAHGGAATGGAARGGDTAVLIDVGDTVGLDGGAAGPGEAAAVVVSLGSVEGGDATGGAASGGSAWGLAGLHAIGGDGAGGDAEGGAAMVELQIDTMVGDQYRAEVDRVVGGDATGGTGIGGDAIELEVVP